MTVGFLLPLSMWLIIGLLTPESLANWLCDMDWLSRAALIAATNAPEYCSDGSNFNA